MRDAPLIMLSARAGEESRVEGMDGGDVDYLVKPFSAREWIARFWTRAYPDHDAALFVKVRF